jgi:hypothetical protein
VPSVHSRRRAAYPSSQGKDALYAQQLDAARLRGDWESPVPVAAAAGGKAPISWQELIRKYMKHNPNSTGV